MKPIAMLATVALLASGCWVRSISPLYTDEDTTFDPRLVGTWVVTDKDGDEETMVFQPGSEIGYDLVYVNRGKAGVFAVRLVKLGDVVFADIKPRRPQGFEGGYTLHLIESHSIVRIEIGKRKTKITPLDHEWLKGAIAAGECDLAHEVIDDLIVLTDSTAKVREFIRAHANDKKAFKSTSVLRRL